VRVAGRCAGPSNRRWAIAGSALDAGKVSGVHEDARGNALDPVAATRIVGGAGAGAG
jgi:hypothetical protein